MPYADLSKRRVARRIARARRMSDPGYRERENSYQRDYQMERRKQNPQIRRNHHALYGLTLGAYDHLVMLQCGACAICGHVPGEDPEASPQTRTLVVDHDHASGMVRGLLCTRCNLMCGQGGDSPGRLETAAKYLREWETCR